MSLRRIVKDATGQDVYLCQGCQDCEIPSNGDMDIPLGSLVQMVIFDDEELLTSNTLWSDYVVQSARYACKKGLDLQAILWALRQEAQKRSIV
jgi:hypothetical protein